MSERIHRGRRFQVGVQVAVAAAVAAAGFGACGSSSPVSSPTTVTRPPATTAPPVTPSTIIPSTTAPPTSIEPATTVPTSTSLPAARRAALARQYKAMVGPADTANDRFVTSLEAYVNGRASLPAFKRAVAVYSAASDRLQSSLLGVRWPSVIETKVTRIVAEDKQLVAQLDGLETVTRSKLKKPLNGVLATLLQIKSLSNQVRKDLGLPQTH